MENKKGTDANLKFQGGNIMIINHNISAMNAYRNLASVNERVDKNMEKLSSGLRINRAGDDAAGLAISEKMRGQIKGLNMATKNAQDGISMIQTAEGALNESHSILQRMRELSVQSANDTNTSEDREKLQLEMNQLRLELDRISTSTEFNTRKLLTGEYAEGGLTFHIGANKDQNVKFQVADMGATYLKVNGATDEEAISISTQEDANLAIETVNNALERVSRRKS
jgi:Flagellin and related hook-associated proteins